MKLPAVTAIWPGFGRARRSGLRASLRGYRVLRDRGDIDLPAEILADLSETPLESVSVAPGSRLFGAAQPEAELATRQRLLLLQAGAKMVAAVQAQASPSGPPVMLPIPPEWVTLLEARGVRCSRAGCRRAFYLFIAKQIAVGVKRMVMGLRQSSSPVVPNAPRVHLADAGVSQLPVTDDIQNNSDLVSWMAGNLARTGGFHSISVPVLVPVSTPKDLEGVTLHGQVETLGAIGKAKGAFLMWMVRALALAGIDLLRGRWWSALMLPDAADAARFRLSPKESGNVLTLFSNSSWFYRPMWTYEAERCGQSCGLFFYSTNCEALEVMNNPAPRDVLGYRAMNWPRYIVWDDAQAVFVERVQARPSRIDVVGTIGYVAQKPLPSDLPTNSVAVFDITPFRPAKYQMMGQAYEFYTSEIMKTFMEDVVSCAMECGLKVVHKSKRTYSPEHDRAYRRVLDRLSGMDAYWRLEADVSARDLIQHSRLSLSIPFTTTALTGVNEGKPAAYYDPTGQLMPQGHPHRAIPLLRSRTELLTWMRVQTGTGDP